jgi:hypothetical protein
VVEDISEACRKEIYSIAGSIDHWAEMTHGRPVGTTLTEEEASDLVSRLVRSSIYPTEAEMLRAAIGTRTAPTGNLARVTYGFSMRQVYRLVSEEHL